MMQQPRGYVYFVKHYSKIKIGFSAFPPGRVKEIGCGKLLAVIPNCTITNERILHKRFAKIRTDPPFWVAYRTGKTEWYKPNSELLEYIQRNASRRHVRQLLKDAA